MTRPAEPPSLQRGILSRPRLAPMMDRVSHHPVVLMYAPAGSGKSILLSDWVRRQPPDSVVAWMACSRLADTPVAFWSALSGSIAAALEETGRVPTRPGSLPSIRRELLDDLLAWLGRLPIGSSLVWDDFQEVAHPQTQRDIQYLVDRLPPVVTLVIVSRSFPQLAINRARVEGRLLELRADDLAFTPDETAELVRINGITLSPDQLGVLQERTQGWAAGLRLAIISMSHANDPAEVVEGLASSTDAVSGYLTEEVLTRLASADRDLLLRICVVSELSQQLVAHLAPEFAEPGVLGHVGGRVGFLSRVHGQPGLYRFHPLFAQLLRQELLHADPQLFAEQHRRAAAWYYRATRPMEAVWHAAQAQDWEAAARAAVDHTLHLATQGRIADLQRLVELFPQDVAASDPRVLLVHAVTLLLGNAPARAAALLERAGASLPTGHDLAARRVRAVATYVTALNARYRGDTRTVLEATSADGPDVPGPDDTGFIRADLDLWAAWRASRASGLLWDDQLADATAWAREACLDVQHGAGGWAMVTSLGVISVASALSGRLRDAERAAEELTQFVTVRSWTDAPYVALPDFGAAWIALERGDDTVARRQLARAKNRYQRFSDSYTGVMIDILDARSTALAGDGPEAARRILDLRLDPQAAVRAKLLLRLVQLVRLEIALAEGDLDEAAALARLDSPGVQRYVAARTGTFDAEDLPLVLREPPWLRIRLLLAGAVVRHRAGDRPGADVLLDLALDVTAAEGFRLPYRQLGEPLRQVLIDARLSALRHGGLVAKLLLETGDQHGVGADLVDPLSARELDVLRHLVGGREVDEIAGDLYVSRNTVRTHTKNIYRKLTVNNRRDAVLRAAALRLI